MSTPAQHTKLDSRAPPGRIDPQADSEISSTSTPSSLAALLADSYKEVESLRRELSIFQTRAEKAEHLSSSFYSTTSPNFPKPDTPSISRNTSTLPSLPGSAAVILMDFENRAVGAEVAREEAEAKIWLHRENWAKLDSYLTAISVAVSDARARYGRILLGYEQPVLAHSPTRAADSASSLSRNHHVSKRRTSTQVFPSDMVRQPHPRLNSGAIPTGSKRPRTPSMDGSQYQKHKKSRGDDVIGYSGESLYSTVISSTHRQPYRIQHRNPHFNGPQHTYPPPPLSQYQHNLYQARQQSHYENLSAFSTVPLHPAPLPNAFPGQHPHHSWSKYPPPHTSPGSRSSSCDASLPAGFQAATSAKDDETLHASIQDSIEKRDSSRMSELERGRPLHNAYRRVHHGGIYECAHEHSYSHSLQNVHPLLQSMSTPDTEVRRRSVDLEYDTSDVGETEESQTLVFAQPLTGVLDETSVAWYEHPTPSVNQQGQRTCWQCGAAGREKDGKCVEKWGPGPLGRGTVCDRCRKKTKRQGKMNTRQQASSSVIPILQSLYRSHANPRRSSHNESESQATLPTATLPARQSPHGSPKGSGIEVQSTTNQVYVAPPPPPKSMRIIASPPRLMH